MGNLSSMSPSLKIEELRDRQSFPVALYTGLGRNGTKQYRLAGQDDQPTSLIGMTIKAVVKTDEDASNTELDTNFPLTATIDNAGQGLFSIDWSAVNFTSVQSRVIMVIYDDSGANPVVLAKRTTVIRKAGI